MLSLERVVKVLVGVSVDTGRGCVCGGKCWMTKMSSTMVKDKAGAGGSFSIGYVERR